MSQGGLHEATLAYQTAPGTLNWTESGTHTGTGCTYEGSGQLAVGPKRPDSAADPPDPTWARLVFELGTRSFAPGARYHVESEGYHGTLAGVHSLEGEAGGDSGSSARVEWSLHPAE